MEAVASKYSFEFPRRQYFSLPYYLISYITENPLSPHGLQKLQKTCKHFYSEKKILYLHGVCWYNGKDYICYDKKQLPLKNIQYWLTHLLIGYAGEYSVFRPHIFNTNILSELIILQGDFSLKEINFLLISKNLDEVNLCKVNIKDEAGIPVPVDYILSKVPYIRKFTYDNLCEICSTETFKNLNSIKLMNKLYWFCLIINRKSEELDPELLAKFIVKNGEISYGAEFRYSVENYIGLDAFKETLQNIVDQLNSSNKKLSILVYKKYE